MELGIVKPQTHEIGEIITPELTIRPQTPDEEMDYLWFVLNSVPFYKEHGYSVEYPEHPEFQRLVAVSPDFDGINRERE